MDTTITSAQTQLQNSESRLATKYKILLGKFKFTSVKLAYGFYKLGISPFLTAISGNLPQHCCFHPTCSDYAKEAYSKRHFATASYLVILRLLKCNPIVKKHIYFDFVPEEKRKITA